MEGKSLFFVFGIIQVLSLGFIVYSILGSVGFSSRIVLSVVFSLFTLIVEYMIYSRE